VILSYDKGTRRGGDKERGDKERGDKEKGDKERGDKEIYILHKFMFILNGLSR
jgi:hypothetical protein